MHLYENTPYIHFCCVDDGTYSTQKHSTTKSLPQSVTVFKIESERRISFKVHMKCERRQKQNRWRPPQEIHALLTELKTPPRGASGHTVQTVWRQSSYHCALIQKDVKQVEYWMNLVPMNSWNSDDGPVQELFTVTVKSHST